MRTLIALILMGGVAVAGELQGAMDIMDIGDHATWTIVSPATPLIITAGYEVFRMEDGACLRGPLKFLDAQGHETFRLEKDVYYPTGCGTPNVPR